MAKICHIALKIALKSSGRTTYTLEFEYQLDCGKKNKGRNHVLPEGGERTRQIAVEATKQDGNDIQAASGTGPHLRSWSGLRGKGNDIQAGGKREGWHEIMDHTKTR